MCIVKNAVSPPIIARIEFMKSHRDVFIPAITTEIDRYRPDIDKINDYADLADYIPIARALFVQPRQMLEAHEQLLEMIS